MRSVMQAAKDKKMGFLKDLVWILSSLNSQIWIMTQNCSTRKWVSSISSQIWIVTCNYSLYVRTYLNVNFRWKPYIYFSYIRVINIFQTWPFLHKNLDICIYCTSIFLVSFTLLGFYEALMA
jgi:hypothetical protein